jgi:flagellar protein FlaG
MGMKIPGVTGPPLAPEYTFPKAESAPPSDPHPQVHPAKSRPPVQDLPGQDLDHAAKILEQTFRLFNKRFKITVNDEIERVVVKVIDGNTDKVIKEIPPQELQRLIARIKETIGLLFDEKI